MMDGGRGQVNIALSVLQELKIAIPVCGMVKDDNHRTRGLYFNNVELPIDTRSEGFKLITRVQDEAHRFAITYHRTLRKSRYISMLEKIPLVGPTKAKILLAAFPNFNDIKEADEATLTAIEGIDKASARSVVEYFKTRANEKDVK